MYKICVLLLCFVRRYCERNSHGNSWYNLWSDMIGDAKCFRPVASTSPLPPPLPPPLASVDSLLERSLKIVSHAQLMHAALAVDEVHLFDVEDIEGHLGMQLEWFGEAIDQLNVDRPFKRPVAKIGDLYDKYRTQEPKMHQYTTTMHQSDGNAYMYLKALLVEPGDSMTLKTRDDETFHVTLLLAAMPSAADIRINDLVPA